MIEDGWMAALHQAWQDGDEEPFDGGTVTLKSLARQIRSWLEGNQAAGASLGTNLARMQRQLIEVILVTERDLAEGLAPELEGHLRGSLETYVDCQPLLDEILQAFTEGDRDTLENQAQRLLEAREYLFDYEQAMNEWLQAPVLRCPRCGRGQNGRETACGCCQADLLYPDADAAKSDAHSSGSLGRDFVAVFTAMVGVLQGKSRISQLMAALEVLEHTLYGWASMAESEQGATGSLARALDTISQSAREGLDGVARMRQVAQTRQTRDLNQGWKVIFRVGNEIRTTIPALTRATGGQTEAGFSGEDSIIIQGD